MTASSNGSVYSNGQSLEDQIGTRLRNISQSGKPVIQIDLDNNSEIHGKWVTSYSTMDSIEGVVSVMANHDTPFEDIQIIFTGTSHTYVDRLTGTPSVSGRMEAIHRFLTLKQPIAAAELPHKELVAGKKYTFPFTFTVPDQLLPRSCSHSVSNDSVRESHLMLPPSMGDPDVAGFGGTLRDDLAPQMSKVIYAIKARILYAQQGDGNLSLLAEKTRKVRIKPVFEEQAPIHFDPSDREYRLRQEKIVKKGLFKGKLGTLTAQSAQPKALSIPGARTTANTPIATMAKVLLRFDPTDETNEPPKLGSLVSKIKVSTYFAASPRKSIPSKSAMVFDVSQGSFQETLPLSSLCVVSAQWQKHTSASNPTSDASFMPRDSGVSGCLTSPSDDDDFHAGILKASKDYRGNSFYTAHIVVPITLPHTKIFLPTFHSCLISRTYMVSMRLSTHNSGFTDSSLHLKVPVQIASKGSDTGNENARARSAEAVVSRETDAIFTPRLSTAPHMGAGGREDLPPQYGAFASTARYQARITVTV